MADEQELAGRITAIAQPLRAMEDLEPLLELVGDARLVLLGEATHGTSEYYLWRARLSQRLIREKDFSFIAVEGDWPDCYGVNRYVKSYEEAGESARDVLHAFERWPTWMWANWEIVALCEWLRQYNERKAASVGFYGLDVYSLWESMEAIINYLERAMPEAVPLAREAYRCFEPFGESEQAYAWSTRMVPESCEDEVIALLGELRRRARQYGSDREAAFNAEQNAQVMVDAERYYRTMVRSDNESWNVRDYHMADTLDRLLQFHGPGSKVIVWAHNTHVGDARATNMARQGLANIGQIARERHADIGVVLVGCSSYGGSVIAADSWGGLMEQMSLPDARAGSWEGVLHCAGADDKLLLLPGERENKSMMQSRGHRAVGVVYQPEYEDFGNYVPTVLPQRYDAVMYFEKTEALHPLHLTPKTTHEPPETYPWGL